MFQNDLTAQNQYRAASRLPGYRMCIKKLMLAEKQLSVILQMYCYFQ